MKDAGPTCAAVGRLVGSLTRHLATSSRIALEKCFLDDSTAQQKKGTREERRAGALVRYRSGNPPPCGEVLEVLLLEDSTAEQGAETDGGQMRRYTSKQQGTEGVARHAPTPPPMPSLPLLPPHRSTRTRVQGGRRVLDRHQQHLQARRWRYRGLSGRGAQ